MANDAFAGPVDYLVFAFPDDACVNAGLAAVLQRVDVGIIEILDLELIHVDDTGTPLRSPLDQLPGLDSLAGFEGAYSGILDTEDVQRVAEALDPGAFAIALVYEDRSLAPAADAWIAAGGAELFAGGVDIIDLANSLDVKGTDR
ncbi:DUF6325 family protein [Leifsonia sp. EB34]|uniref:DUF6325 family protein n=1 Tax=Leifsonia sp. EB34 TaxID=3156303 RepID=UPI003515FE6C